MRQAIETLVLGWVLVLGVGNGVRAQAADDPDLQRAVTLFEESERLYNEGEFREAARLLERAYALHPDPLLQYNRGRALESAGDIDGAIDAYGRYLDEAPDAQDRGAIEQRLRTLRAQRERLAESEPVQDEPETAAETQSATPEASDGGGRSAMPFVLGGAGIAAAGVGLVFGLMSKSKHDDADAARIQRDAHDLQSDAETFALVANVTLVTGAVLFAAGVVWFALDGSGGDDAEAGTSLGVGFGRLVLSTRF